LAGLTSSFYPPEIIGLSHHTQPPAMFVFPVEGLPGDRQFCFTGIFLVFDLIYLFFIFIFVVLEFELRASCLKSRHSTNLPVHFCF
jgi:hypothetical protein